MEWQRLEQHGIHQTEDRRIHAGAERQRNDGYQREARFLQQHARAVAQVLPESLHMNLIVKGSQESGARSQNERGSRLSPPLLF